MKYFFLLIVLFMSGCAQEGDSPVEVSIGHEFMIRVGQHVILDGGNLALTFVEVSGDSRCPDNARCIWSGNGTVRMMVRAINSTSTSADLNTHVDPRRLRIGPYDIELVSLNPYPHAGRTIDPGEYVATLLVSMR